MTDNKVKTLTVRNIMNDFKDSNDASSADLCLTNYKYFDN